MNIFEQTEKLFGLEADSEYLAAKKIYEDTTKSKTEHDEARVKLANIVATKMLKDNKGYINPAVLLAIAPYCVNYKAEGENIEFTIGNIDDDSSFNKILYLLNSIGADAKESYYLDEMARGIIRTGEQIHATSAVEYAKKVTKNMPLDEKEKTVIAGLIEIKEQTVHKVYQDNKDDKKKAKGIVKQLQDRYIDLKDSIESGTYDWRSVYEEYLNFEKEFIKAYKNGEPNYTSDRTSSAGSLDIPPKKDKKKVALYIAGTFVVVSLVVGEIFFVRSISSKPAPINDPSVSDTIVDITDEIPTEEPTVTETVSPTNSPSGTTQTTGNNAGTTTTTPGTSTTTTPTPTETSNPSSGNSNNSSTVDSAVETKINTAADTIYANWSNHGSTYTKENIKDLIKVLNGYETSMSIDTADGILVDMLNKAIVPGSNNASLGGKYFATNSIDFCSLLINGQIGSSAVKSMQLNMNGALTDVDNLAIYSERAITDEVLIATLGQTVEDFNLTTVDPAVKILWARLAIGMNAMAVSAEDEFQIDVNGTIYTMSDVNNSMTFENIVTSAKQELGQNSKTLNLS